MNKNVNAAAFAFAFFALSSLTVTSVSAQSAPDKTVHYKVDLSDTKNHYVTITLTANVNQPATQLMMPVWTPGSYVVREFARHIDSIEAQSETGKKLECRKVRKNRWQIETSDAKKISVSYRIYANELSVRTNFTGKQYAILNGAPTFLTLPDRLNEKHVVALQLPKGWTKSATSITSDENSANTYVAQNYDEIVDSPIVAGNIHVYPFEVSGVAHQLVNIGESGYWDGTKAAADLKKLVAAHHEFWETVPYKRYLFLNAICESGGGLEHDNSTLMMTSRWTYRDKRRYDSWLSLASHEFFHTWNVRRLRPKSLVKYDYETEVYTPSLWVAEGITSYYEDVLLVRAGLMSQREYLDRLSANIQSVQRAEGRKKQSLRESSYDTWIKFYRRDENSSNTQISYYSKGAVVGWLLDAKIRELTANKKSLDDVMRAMYREFANGKGYTSSDFRNVVNRVAEHDLSSWFAATVDSTKELDYSQALPWFGLTLDGIENQNPLEKPKTIAAIADKPAADKPAADKAAADKPADNKPAKNENKIADKKTPAEAKPPTKKGDSDNKKSAGKKTKPKPTPTLGIRIDNDNRVTRVRADSAATKSGLNTGDEIIAINDFRLRGDLNSRLKQFEIGDELELLIARRGKLLTLRAIIDGQISRSWKLTRLKKPSTAQQANIKAWLEKTNKPKVQPNKG